MAAPTISISSDSSEESVGSHASRVILFAVIPAIIPVIPEVPIVPADPIVAPEVGTVLVVSPTGVLDLVDYSSSSNSDPSEDSLPPALDLPLVSPFLCSDDSEVDGESEPAEQRPKRHESLTLSSEFPLAPVVAPPGIRRRPAILVRPGEAIPFGRPYRTHLNGPRKLLTARKRVGPIPARRLAWRRVSHHSSDRHSSLDSSSLGSPSDHSLSGHTPPDTTDVDTSTPPRFVHQSLARTPRRSEAFRHLRSAPLSTSYPPTTSESSLGSSSERSLDSSSPSSGPSRKRCRSPTTSVPSPTYVSRSIAPTPADLLPPRKRFRDSYSLEDSGEEHMEVDTADAEAVADVGDDEDFEAEASAADTREIVVDPLAIGDSSKSSRGGIPDLEDTIYDIVYYMSERASLVERIGSLRLEYLKVRAMLSIERDRVDSLRWYMALSHEEFRQVHRDHDDTRRRLRRLESTMTITRSGMTPEAIEELVNRRVEEALAAYEEARAANALEAENQSQNGSDGDNGNGGNVNDGNRNGGNGNTNENGRGDRPVARECTYQDFMKCQPLNFKGTEGVVGLIRWFEKMETVFHISNCPEKYQVKYTTCTLLNNALTWWNSHKRTIGAEAAFAMSWRELMKLMAEVYCPRNEIQKMESEHWNLTVKNNDLAAYTQRFQELTMMCTKMVPEEEDRVEKFIRGLSDNIQGNVIAAEPTKLLTGPELVHETTEKIIQIKKRIQAARDRQKSYADRRRKPLEFEVGDKVMLKVSPWKGVIRFGKRGKLNPRYIGPFKILAKVGTRAYRLELPEKLSRVHSTFHVSNLKRCLVDEPLAIPLDEIQIDDKLNFIEEPVEIIDQEVKRLKQSRIPIVKVRWNSRRGPEFTWEREDQIKKKYPYLFVNPSSTS
ncbi:putative reverse transcriptase domain-containing protein [Tanacetum coccineum]